jgi:translation initiation factor 2D
MFKKQIENLRLSLIKTSDKRKLKADIVKAFPSLTLDDLELIMPSKQDLYCGVASGSKQIIYLDSHKEPLFFDLYKGDLYPSVYALWILPPFLPTFEIHPDTFHFIQSGADLMMPGVIEPQGGFPNFLVGEKYTITLKGSPKPIVIGKTVTNLQNAQKNNMKGKCLEVVHTYSDFLWRFGSKSHPPVSMNGRQSLSLTSNDEEEEKPKNIEENENEKNSGDLPSVIVEGEEEAMGEKEDNNIVYNVEQLDADLDAACIYALKKSVTKDTLPMLINLFYTKHMIPCRPLGASLDIKHSSHKKLINFLRHISDIGLIDLKEESAGVFNIVNIYKDNDRIKNFVLHDLEPVPIIPVDPNAIIPLEPIEELWGLNMNMRFICPADVEAKKFYKLNFLNDMLWDYVKDQKLVHPKMAKNIILDANLCNGLFTKKDDKQVGDIVEKKEIGLLFKNKLVTAHKISINGIYEQRKGLPIPIEIKVEKRQNKNVTIIHGLVNYGIDLNFFAAFCSKKFASTCNVQKIELSSEKFCWEVWVQGKRHEEVGEIITDQYKLPPKYVKITPLKPSSGKKRGK